MKTVLVISSFVAGSNVGGSLAMKVLPQLGFDCALLPTVTLGRHPGWGAPGGGAVPFEMFSGMADGLLANGIPADCAGVVTGYFASEDQVVLAANIIRNHVKGRAPVIIDPIMGDIGKGLYVKEEVARAIIRELVPIADVITPNSFEFWEIERRQGHEFSPKEQSSDRLRIEARISSAEDGLARFVTSVTENDRVGIMDSSGEYGWADLIVDQTVPNGVGDLTTLLIADACIRQSASEVDVTEISARVQMQIRKSKEGDELNSLL